MAANRKEAIARKIMQQQAMEAARKKLLTDHQRAREENAKVGMTPIQKHQAERKRLTPVQEQMRKHQQDRKANRASKKDNK